MFGIGPMELVVIALVAIVFVGPKRLPEMMRKVGKMFVQVRRQTEDIRSTMADVMRDAERELELDRIKELKDKMNQLNPKEMLRSAINDDGKLPDDQKIGQTKEDGKDDDYHESHYIDGAYHNHDEGFLDARLLEDNGWKHLKPKDSEQDGSQNPNAASSSNASKATGPEASRSAAEIHPNHVTDDDKKIVTNPPPKKS